MRKMKKREKKKTYTILMMFDIIYFISIIQRYKILINWFRDMR